MTAYPELTSLAARHPVVADAVAVFVAGVGALRGERLLDDLERAGVRGTSADRDAVEQYLRGDEAIEIGMAAAWANPGLAGVIGGHAMTEPADSAQALQIAGWWRRQAETLPDATARRAAVRIHNGYMRRST